MKSDFQIYLSPYFSFIDELHNLLNSSGITPSRLPVWAEFQKKINRGTPESGDTKQQVGQVILYIEEHWGDELSLENLAEEIGLSKYQLIRRFRDEEGTTPWKFLMRKRIEKAKELLEDGISPVQTAVEAGFYDQSHFSKIFRRETGFTPKAYQEEKFRNKN